MIKIFAIATVFAFITGALAEEKIIFQSANDLNMLGFELNKSNRAILKVGDGQFIRLELLNAIRESEWDSYTESCSIRWTLITPSSVQSGIARESKQYTTKQTGPGSFTISSSNHTALEIGGISIWWYYDSRNTLHLHPPPDIKFAIISVPDLEETHPSVQSEPNDESIVE